MNTLKLVGLLAATFFLALIQSCKLPIVEPACPTIQSVSPSSARAGATITVTGTGFIAKEPGAYKVLIGGKPVTGIEVPDESTLTFTVPEGIGSGDVTVSLASGTVCNATTAFTYQFTVSGLKTFASGFDKPAGLDVDAGHNVIAADRDNQVIKLIPANGGTPQTLAGIIDNPGGENDGENNTDRLTAKFRSPEDVAVDNEGNIYVSDYGNNCIRMISVDEPRRDVTTAAGILSTIGGDDTGEPLASGFSGPTGIAVTKDNNLVTVEYSKHRLRYINFVDPSVTNLIDEPGLNFPNRVAFSEKRDPLFPIFVADKKNDRILQVNMNGQSNNKPISIPSPHDLTIDESGNIFVLKREGNEANPAGVYIIYADNSISKIIQSTTAFQLKAPSGIAIDVESHTIYISDDGLGRIASATYK